MGRSRRLRKSRNQWIDGVLGGLGEYMQINPDLLRVAFIVLFVLDFQVVIPVYFLLMIFMPSRRKAVEDDVLNTEIDDDFEEVLENEDDDYEKVYGDELGNSLKSTRSYKFFGGLLIFIGLYILFRDHLDIYSRQFYAQWRHLKYALAPYREGIFAVLLIGAGGWLWIRGRK